MKRFLLVLSLFSFFFYSCSKETIVTPQDNSSNGTVGFTLDKTTIPANVTEVRAKLSREGYTTITSNLDLVNSTSASVILKDVATGLWKLRVEAYNSTAVLVYEGETEVEVKESSVTNVNLTLNPISTSGVGSVNITVSWGDVVVAGPWKPVHTPVLIGSQYFEYNGVAHPCVIIEPLKYSMWYTGVSTMGQSYIGYAHSQDGKTWTKNFDPVLSPSTNGWDKNSVSLAKVLKEDNGYKMYYTSRDENDNVSIGLALSSDGINWTKHGSPILTITGKQVQSADIIVFNNQYYLYYVDINNGSPKINLATSSDGINFTFETAPVITATLPWETKAIYGPTIIEQGNQLQMYYLSYDDGRYIGKAFSTDGKTWNKNPHPVFDLRKVEGDWAFRMTDLSYAKLDKNIMINDGFEHKIYFSAHSKNEHYSIGYTKYGVND